MISIIFINIDKVLEIREVEKETLIGMMREYQEQISYLAKEADMLISKIPSSSCIQILNVDGEDSRHRWVSVYSDGTHTDLSLHRYTIGAVLRTVPKGVFLGIDRVLKKDMGPWSVSGEGNLTLKRFISSKG